MDDLKRICQSCQEVFDEYAGEFIKQIDLRVDYEFDQLVIAFFPIKGRGEMSVRLDGVRYFEFAKPPELAGSFVDRLEVTCLPTLDRAWPAEAEKKITRFAGLPELVWFRITGPVEVEVFCDGLSVSFSGPSPDAAHP